MDQTTETDVGWHASNFDAKLASLMADASWYPTEEEEDEQEPVRTSVSLTPEAHAEIQLIADLWNELDQLLGKKQKRKWKPSSVMERFIRVGIAGFWSQVGGRPATSEGRGEYMRAAIAKLRDNAKAKQKK